jgi:hypothetical protein
MATTGGTMTTTGATLLRAGKGADGTAGAASSRRPIYIDASNGNGNGGGGGRGGAGGTESWWIINFGSHPGGNDGLRGGSGSTGGTATTARECKTFDGTTCAN